MTPATELMLKTLAYSWIAGALAGAFLGWLLVPAALSVEYLTPIVVTGPFAGLIAPPACSRIGVEPLRPIGRLRRGGPFFMYGGSTQPVRRCTHGVKPRCT